jgi:CheY-like chemotaxis protein
MTHILVVDDDPLIGKALRAWLEAEQFEVALADGARTGLHALAGAAFDVMIIDIFMPEMDGLESIRIFNQRAPKVPIIAISGHRFPERHGPAPDFLGMSTHLGAAYCLRKPFRPKDLLRAVEQCLGGRVVWPINDFAKSPGAPTHAS